MSRKNKTESHQGSKKSESSNKAIAVIILLGFLGIMPILIWVSLPETSTYTSVTTASPWSRPPPLRRIAGLFFDGVPPSFREHRVLSSQVSSDCNYLTSPPLSRSWCWISLYRSPECSHCNSLIPTGPCSPRILKHLPADNVFVVQSPMNQADSRLGLHLLNRVRYR
jgi:hypothetical protein